jgi:peptide/nickel transport system substrate-binding protein
VAVVTVAALGAAACGAPSENATGDQNGDTTNTTQRTLKDPTAKGPAPAVAGARAGGVITVYSQNTPNTFDPTDIYYVDTNEIGKLVFRTPTQFAMRDGQAVLVPDLTDLGTESADRLSWTFKLQKGIKYQDGTEVTAQDLAYSVKRSFAHDVYSNGPAYQLTLFKDGDRYKGPYADGLDYSGVETPDDYTLVIHLAKPWGDLPFYLSFPAFTPIPQAKDTKQEYKNNPVATGPYQFESYAPGTELKLKRNPHWVAETDPVRHQYVDGWVFKWGQEDVKTQQSIVNSNGPDRNAVNYQNVDSTILPQLTGTKKDQLVTGTSPCNAVYQLDTRKIPLEVRKAVALAYPYDQHWTSRPAPSCRRACPATRSTSCPASPARARATRPRPRRPWKRPTSSASS